MSGLPLLSGPPPVLESTRADAVACRKCSKEFNFLLTRSRKCNHCGYLYCHSCTDYQGLMPRIGSETGYDAMNVCSYCVEYLTITAGGRGYLKSLSLSKLKKYITAYNIKADRAVEKDDLIDAILAAKAGNGCLSPAHENYYRKYSVPDRSNVARSRGIFSSRPSNVPQNQPPPPPRPNQAPAYEFPRPDLVPDDHPPQPLRYAPPPGPPPQSTPSTAPPRVPYQPQYHAPPPRPSASRPPAAPTPQYHNPQDQYHSQNHFNSHLGAHPPYHNPPPVAPRATRPQQPNLGPYQHPGPRPSRSTHNLNNTNDRTPPRPRAASTAPPPTVPPPTLDQLLAMSPDSVSSLSVHALKGILFTNHVNPGQVLEKSDLIKKVKDLVEEERLQRERRRLAEEQEEQERIERQRVMMEQFTRTQKEKEDRDKAAADHSAAGDSAEGASSSAPPPLPPKAQAMASHLERTGLCVICQDEEANIAIVDCGHLAMCRGCSDLVMGSSRECPLCRTRIVTEARLLRIFKT
ncbi:hypothetical protein C8F04DRAFT_614622 [Mycena alexandri]|uniref:RING-type domain-containing protein n=1 Tax=Mycena alexandri TaxID=1745969 RepID=A0AAD6STE6_9AGAR|nr:hypothetical protein C8F04DRAFT_614622 [Mycena alexandri]